MHNMGGSRPLQLAGKNGDAFDHVPDIFAPVRLTVCKRAAVLRRGLHMVVTTRGESRLSREYKVC
jgi:hypothetical protein